MIRRRSLALVAAAVAIAFLSLGAVLGTVSETTGQATAGSSAEWVLPNGDLSNHRRANSQITSANVDDLEVAWTRDVAGTTAYGSFASMPLIADGTVYLHDLQSNVAAVDLESGETKWTRDYNQAVIGPNGLVLHEGTLYGVTRTTVFALDPADGSERWRRNVLTGGRHFSIAPQVHDGRLYAGTITRAGGGIIFVLDAETGDTLWTFNTLKDPTVIPANVAAGGVWYTPLVRPNGSVYFGTGNSYITPRHGLEHPDEILYTISLLKLDSRTGKLDWHFQAVPNDFYDWDLHLSPLWVQDRGRPMVIASGKVGYIYALNPSNGKLLWKTQVGDHNGHDNDSRMALENPGSITDMINAAIADGGMELEPGVYGGVETPMAYQDGVVYAAVVNLETTLCGPPLQPPACLDINYGGATGTFDFTNNEGEMVALDVKTGRVIWFDEAAGDGPRRRDHLQRPRLHDHLRRQGRRALARGRLHRLAGRPAGEDQRAAHDRRRHPRDRGQLPRVRAERPQGRGVPPGAMRAVRGPVRVARVLGHEASPALYARPQPRQRHRRLAREGARPAEQRGEVAHVDHDSQPQRPSNVTPPGVRMDVSEVPGGRVIATLYGGLGVHFADQVRDVLTAAIPYGRPALFLDLRDVEFIDVAGARVLHQSHLLAQWRGGRLVLVSPQPTIRQTIGLLGLTDIPITDDRSVLGHLGDPDDAAPEGG